MQGRLCYLRALLATRSLLADLMLHTSALGFLSLGAATVAHVRTPLPALAWAVGTVMALVPLPLVWLLVRNSELRVANLPVLGWTILETLCQLATYVLAVTAVGAELPATRTVAMAPLVYISDLVMITPAGLGLREALFAAVFDGLSGAPADLGVAAGLVISAMLFVAAAVGGGIAALLPTKNVATASRDRAEP